MILGHQGQFMIKHLDISCNNSPFLTANISQNEPETIQNQDNFPNTITVCWIYDCSLLNILILLTSIKTCIYVRPWSGT